MKIHPSVKEMVEGISILNARGLFDLQQNESILLHVSMRGLSQATILQ
jgi:hypothetical protein